MPVPKSMALDDLQSLVETVGADIPGHDPPVAPVQQKGGGQFSVIAPDVRHGPRA